MEEGGKVAERAVFPAAFVAIDDQHAGRGAVGEGLLRDEVVGEVVVEIGELQSSG
jgi:hypothetical protein